jgi:hypothetical protein
MKQLSTFRGDHFVLHVSKNYERNTNDLKDYPYDLILSSKFAHAPLNKEELLGLADFIHKVLKKNDDNQTG